MPRSRRTTTPGAGNGNINVLRQMTTQTTMWSKLDYRTKNARWGVYAYEEPSTKESIAKLSGPTGAGGEEPPFLLRFLCEFYNSIKILFF